MNPLPWRHNWRDGVSNHQLYDCLLSRLFRRRSKKTSKFRFTGLCVGNSPITGEFTAQMVSNAENGSIWWRHHAIERMVLLVIVNTVIVNMVNLISWHKAINVRSIQSMHIHVLRFVSVYFGLVLVDFTHILRGCRSTWTHLFLRSGDVLITSINSLAPGRFYWNFR